MRELHEILITSNANMNGPSDKTINQTCRLTCNFHTLFTISCSHIAMYNIYICCLLFFSCLHSLLSYSPTNSTLLVHRSTLYARVLAASSIILKSRNSNNNVTLLQYSIFFMFLYIKKIKLTRIKLFKVNIIFMTYIYLYIKYYRVDQLVS